MKCNYTLFLVLGGFKLILLIYGWFGWTNKMKYPDSVYKNPNPNWEYIGDFYFIVYSLFTLTLNRFDLKLKKVKFNQSNKVMNRIC